LPAYAALAFIAVLPGAAFGRPDALHSRAHPIGSRAAHRRGQGSLANPAPAPHLHHRRTDHHAIDLFSFYLPIYGRSIGLSASAIGAISDAGRGGLRGALVDARLATHFGERRLLAVSVVMAGLAYLPSDGRESFRAGLMAFVLGWAWAAGSPLSIILTYNDSLPAAPRGAGLRLAVTKLTQIAVPLVFGSLGTRRRFPGFWSNACSSDRRLLSAKKGP